jgi:UDP-glucose 4-epimerase
MSHYLVTGGCGFIGSHLVDALYAQHHSVRILDDLSTGTTDYCPSDAELVVGDVADPDLVARSFRDIDGCFHLAAVASVERGNADWLGTHRINLSGAIAVFDAARSAARGDPVPVVFASSAAVYGDPVEVPVAECAAPRPVSAYGADKLGCELHAYVASHVHHVPTCGLRFFNVYGPRQRPNSPYSGVISVFCDRLKRAEPVTVHGDGGQTRDFIYVGDVVRALLVSMRRCSIDSGVVNVCTGRATAVDDLAFAIARLLRRKPRVRRAAPRTADIRHSVGDPRKAREVLGFSADVELAAGLARTLAAR